MSPWGAPPRAIPVQDKDEDVIERDVQIEEDEECKKEMEECILKVLEEELGEELGEVQE